MTRVTLARSIAPSIDCCPCRLTRLRMCLGFKAPEGDRFAWQSSVAEQRARNPQVKPTSFRSSTRAPSSITLDSDSDFWWLFGG